MGIEDGRSSFPLAAERRQLGEFLLVTGELRPLRRSGWSWFTLFLVDRSGGAGERPVVQGVYSRGGKDGVRPWMDIEYSEECPAPPGNGPGRIASLSGPGLDRLLFRILGEAIPPGGHAMVSYEGNQPIHLETMLSLSLGVPPVATPIGVLLFGGGFSLVKDWYLAEGGMEGPRKLWGEKAPDLEWERIFRERTRRQLDDFSSRPRLPGEAPALAASRDRAAGLLAEWPGPA